MSRFSAATLDLSRVDRASIFPTLSFEAIREGRMADLKDRLTAAGIPYDVESLETDPGAILQQSSGYRELLAHAAIQDATASVLLAFATGAHLDRLGDPTGTARQDGEDDARYRARIQLAPEALSTAGTEGGYIYHAVSASVDVRDVAVAVLGRGTSDVSVEIVVLSRLGDGTPSPALVGAVRGVLSREDIGLTTDAVVVRGARIVPYDLEVILSVQRGPDPAVVRAAAEAALATTADRYKRIGKDVPYSALLAAVHVAGVDSASVSVTTQADQRADVRVLRFQAAHLRAATVKTVQSYG